MKTTKQARVPIDVFGNAVQLKKNLGLKKVTTAMKIQNGANTWQVYKIERKPKNKKRYVMFGRMEFEL